MTNRKKIRVIAVIMLLLAIVFLIYALHHPEASFSLDVNVTHTIYGVYILGAVVLLIVSFVKK